MSLSGRLRCRYDLTRPPVTDPTALYRYRDRLDASFLLSVALAKFDIVSYLKEVPSSAAQIAARFGFAERPCDVYAYAVRCDRNCREARRSVSHHQARRRTRRCRFALEPDALSCDLGGASDGTGLHQDP